MRAIRKKAKSRITAEYLADHILSLLPQDGTPILNRVMRVMLSRELQQQVAPDVYFEARDALVRDGKAGRLRGQGGQLFLIIGPPPQAAPAPIEDWPEARLMEPLRRYLNGPFRQGLDLSSDGFCIVHDTSVRGPRRGQWAQPDYVLVSAMRFKFISGCQVDVHSFELKTESGGTVQAVHEALAQTRFTHFGHLVWHLPDGSKAEARLAEIEKHCDEHGIGLIRMRDPSDAERFEILVDPVRKVTALAAVDGFLEARLTAEQCDRLAAAVIGAQR